MGKISSLLKLKPFIKKYRMYLGIGIIGIILSSIVANPVPRIIGRIMDEVLIGSRSYSEFYKYIVLIAILHILRYVISIASKYMFIRINNLVVNEMRYSVMKKVMDLNMSYLAKTEKGYVQSRMGECSSIGNIFSPSIIGVFLSIFDAIFAITVMLYINYKLALVVLLLIPIFFLSARASSKGFMKNTHDMLESNAVLNGECFEIINGIEEIKILGGKNTHLKRFEERLHELIKSSIKQSKAILFFIENTTIINDFGSLLVLFVAGIMVLNGGFTIGLYTSFSLYIAKVFASTQGIATIGTTIKPICMNIERLYELLDMDDENTAMTEELNERIETIKINNLSFAYDSNSDNVLNSLNFNIQKGEKVVIRGENGSGKSTLIKLLLGLYVPSKGEILYNNVNLISMNKLNLRVKIGVVSQNIFLFKGTVLDNILYGLTGKTRKDVEELIKETDLEEYISKFPKGLDTEVIQNTSGVSGGQAQVLAFIRAILSSRDVIILDEPISNVDFETRNIILDILRKRSYEGILIIISHITEGLDFIDRVIEI